MQRDFAASAGDIAWMVTAYLLVASIATPIFGRLGDMFGEQRLLQSPAAGSPSGRSCAPSPTRSAR